MPFRREPYVPCSRRKRADADAVGKNGAVVLSFERGAGSANPDAGDDCVVDGGLAFVSKHDELPDESIVLGLTGTVSTPFVLCRYAGWLIPLDVVLPVPFALAALPECDNQGPTKVTSPMNAWTIRLAMSISMPKIIGWSPAQRRGAIILTPNNTA